MVNMGFLLRLLVGTRASRVNRPRRGRVLPVGMIVERGSPDSAGIETGYVLAAAAAPRASAGRAPPARRRPLGDARHAPVNHEASNPITAGAHSTITMIHNNVRSALGAGVDAVRGGGRIGAAGAEAPIDFV